MLKRIIVYGVLLLWLCIAPVWFARDRAYQEAVVYVEQQATDGWYEFDFKNPNLANLPPQINATLQGEDIAILYDIPKNSLYLDGSWKPIKFSTLLPPEIWEMTNLKGLYVNGTSLTSLPSAIGNLTNLESLTLRNTSLATLPPEIGNLTNLRSLDLSGTSITSLPPEIGNLTNLQILNLSETNITSLPPEIGNLANLKFLYLSGTQITSLPPEIANLSNLMTIDLSNTFITSLPHEISDLIKLTKFDLSGTSITTLLPEIGNLTNLDTLNLSGTQITSLPSEIGKLSNLLDISLSNTPITTLPSEIGNLTNLIYLHLSGTQITTLPSEIGNLTNLDTLNLHGSSLMSLPPEIGQLMNVYKLDLSETALTSLPPEIGNLTQLPTLTVRGTQITALPPEIGNLTNLYSLDAGNTPLTSLPPEIANLSNLETLDLSGSQLGSLPPEIGNFRILNTLNLAYTPLTTLPPEIGNLYGLGDLNLRGTNITSLPPEIGNLTYLHWLDLSDTALTTFPPEIYNLRDLTRLELNNTGITALPPEIGNFGRLQYLDLSDTRITTLPSEIGNLHDLQHLRLEDTPLKALPLEIGNLNYLQYLGLSGTALMPVPPEISKLTQKYTTALSWTGYAPEMEPIYDLTISRRSYTTGYGQDAYNAMAIVYGGGFVAFIFILGISFAIYKRFSRRPRALITPNKTKDSCRLTIYHVRWIASLVACLLSFVPFVVYLGDRWGTVEVGNRHFIFVMLGAYLVAYGLTIATTVKTAQRLAQEGDIYNEGNTNRLNLWKNVLRQSIESHIWLAVPRFGIALGCAQIFHTYFDNQCNSLSQLRFLVRPYCHFGTNGEMFVNPSVLPIILAILFVFACVECGLISAMASFGMRWRGIVLRRGLVWVGVLLFIGAYSLYPIRGEVATRVLTQSSDTWLGDYDYNRQWREASGYQNSSLGEVLMGLHKAGMSWVDSGILLSADLLREEQINVGISPLFSSGLSALSGVISLLGLLLAMAWYIRKLRRG
jgi:Leucine-rich repeat (LRR) protein